MLTMLQRFEHYPGTWACSMLAALSFVSAAMGDIRGSGTLGAGLALIFVALAGGSFLAERRGARQELAAATGPDAGAGPAARMAERTDGATGSDDPQPAVEGLAGGDEAGLARSMSDAE